MFPIQRLDSPSVLHLCRVFCTNFCGITQANLVYSNIYVRQENGWIPLASFTQQLTPLHEIRVAVILKPLKQGDDLTGLPLSLQVIRTDTLPDIDGPVYKGMSLLTFKSIDNGNDKGLLAGTDEENFLSNETKKFFGFVFHPFYHFKGALMQGIKPCGFIGMSSNAHVDCALRLKIGDRRLAVKYGGGTKEDFTVRLPLENSVCLEMIMDRSFRENKTSARPTPRVFLSQSTVNLSGYMLRQADRSWKYFDYKSNSHLHFYRHFSFSWTRPFEIIFLINSDTFGKDVEGNDPIKFPVGVLALEDNVINLQGPTYDAEGVSLSVRPFRRGTTTLATVQPYLVKQGIVSSTDKFVDTTKVIEMKGQTIIHDYYLFAVAVRFSYMVENDTGDLLSYEALKPFGKEYYVQGGKDYEYLFHLKGSVGTGLSITDTRVFHFPGLPGAAQTMPFLTNQKLVTLPANQTSLQIQQCDIGVAAKV